MTLGSISADESGQKLLVLHDFANGNSNRARRYRQAVRQAGTEVGPDRAELHVHSAIADHFDLDDPVGVEQAGIFIDAVLSSNEVLGFAAVVAAALAIRLARWTDAEEVAERLVASDQHDIFAQRLLLAARERSEDLSLAIDNWLADRFCGNPFEEIEIRANGAVHTCCSGWMPVSIGSIYEDAAETFWNSAQAQELRRSVLDGDFSHCSRMQCPKIVNRTLPLRKRPESPAQKAWIAARQTTVGHKPRRVLLSQDRSCNLSCPSCRKDLILLDRKKSDELDKLFDLRIEPLLDEALQIKVTGSGDPFGSRHFRHVLKRLTGTASPSKRIQIQTNAILCDEKAWSDLGLVGHVSTVWVSIDAAKAETYAVLRRLGSFDRLLDNLVFLGRMRAAKRIDEFRMDFVVQAENFREIGDFVDLANRMGADGVHFLMLRNWGTFSVDEYRERNIGSTNHPEHGEFLEVLRDPRLAAPNVDLGNVRASFDEARPATPVNGSWWNRLNPFRLAAT